MTGYLLSSGPESARSQSPRNKEHHPRLQSSLIPMNCPSFTELHIIYSICRKLSLFMLGFCPTDNNAVRLHAVSVVKHGLDPCCFNGQKSNCSCWPWPRTDIRTIPGTSLSLPILLGLQNCETLCRSMRTLETFDYTHRLGTLRRNQSLPGT